MKLDISLSMPGRTFVMGEYLIDRCHQALILTTAPNYELGCAITEEELEDEDRLHGFPEDHPSVDDLRMRRWCDAIWLHYDPYHRQVGFGGDLTLAALVRQACSHLTGDVAAGESDRCALIEALKADMSQMGHDIDCGEVLAQIMGGFCFIDSQSGKTEQVDLPQGLTWSLLPSPYEKRQMPRYRVQCQPLKEVYEYGHEAWQQGRWDDFFSAIDQYHDVCQAQGLIDPSQQKVVESIRSVGVSAVKACGYMGKDAIIVFHHHSLREKVHQIEMEREGEWVSEDSLGSGLLLELNV